LEPLESWRPHEVAAGRVVVGVALLNYLDRQVIFSLFPLLEKDLQASPFQLGLISTVFLWTYGLLSPFGGWWPIDGPRSNHSRELDRVERRDLDHGTSPLHARNARGARIEGASEASTSRRARI